MTDSLSRTLNTAKAWVFVHIIRRLLKRGDNRSCPMCGQLLQFYDDYGWLHMADGDADCYGALGYGKGRSSNTTIRIKDGA